ncbi:YeiH family protein [Vaginisenegalia massiliensis]|uniref:YeiH family protein n=1 Tax=Vaginisenegalia massiliensis TaxID=2058294 RepID=UPI000F51CC77|nr:putative sulfate exporter family transporter [Vaginisenegalia massiliensis]
MNRIRLYLPLIVVTLTAYLLAWLIPFLESQITAILLGMALASSSLGTSIHKPTMKRAGSNFLKYGIVLLGFTLSFQALTGVGLASLRVTLVCILAAFATAFLAGRRLGVAPKTQALIGMGTAICGGSAIAAAAPIVEAEEDDIAFAIATIFLYNTLALLVFPLLGQIIGFSDLQFGVFAGSAINDTSSVVAAGFGFSDAAGSFATVVKLVRTLMIVPVCLALIIRKMQAEKMASTQSLKLSDITRIIPQFVLWFMAAIVFASLFPLPVEITHLCKQVSRIIMTMALAGVGLTVNFAQIKKAGARPLILGGLTWAAVIATSLAMIAIFY